MARKIKNDNNRTSKEFTKNIHSSIRSGTEFSGMANHNEKLAKSEKRLCCHDCRFYGLSCYEYIGMYHQPCKDFKWW